MLKDWRDYEPRTGDQISNPFHPDRWVQGVVLSGGMYHHVGEMPIPAKQRVGPDMVIRRDGVQIWPNGGEGR